MPASWQEQVVGGAADTSQQRRAEPGCGSFKVAAPVTWIPSARPCLLKVPLSTSNTGETLGHTWDHASNTEASRRYCGHLI